MKLDELRSILAVRDCRPTGNGTIAARCPAHDDARASLSVTEAGNGKLLLHCHAGCEPVAVCAALGIELADLFPGKTGNGAGHRIVATYGYRDETGALLFEVVRFEPKDFRQRAPDGTWKTKETIVVPPGERSLPEERAMGLKASQMMVCSHLGGEP